MATFTTTNQYINYSVNSNEDSWDLNSNTSRVHVWVDVWRTNTGYTTYGSGTVTVWCDGQSSSASITSDQKITSTPIRILDAYFTVGHNNDGSKTAYISGQINHARFSSGNNGYNHSLTTIPRASDASITYNGLIGDVLTVKISRKSSAFTHALFHDFLVGSWTQFASNVASEASFTTPLNWLDLMPSSVTASGRILVRTYNGNSIVGDKIYNFAASAKDDIVPSFDELLVTPINSFGKLYLQGISSAKLAITGAKGVHGSTINNYSITSGDLSYSGNKSEYTTGVLNKAGEINFTATITDSRGRTATKNVIILVTAYTLPTLIFDTYRCDGDGKKDIIKGTNIYVKPNFTYCNITGNAIRSKEIMIDGEVVETAFETASINIFEDYPLTETHIVTVTIGDAVGNKVTVSHDIGVGKVIINVPNHKNGIAFGRYLDKEGQAQFDYDLNLFGKFLVNNLEQPIFKLVETVDVDI